MTLRLSRPRTPMAPKRHRKRDSPRAARQTTRSPRCWTRRPRCWSSMAATPSRCAPTRTPRAPSARWRVTSPSWRAGASLPRCRHGQDAARAHHRASPPASPLYDELAEVPRGLRQMTRIPGLGPKRVRQINRSLGITTLDELKAAAETGKIAGLPGFGAEEPGEYPQGAGVPGAAPGSHLFPEAEAQAEAVAGSAARAAADRAARGRGQHPPPERGHRRHRHRRQRQRRGDRAPVMEKLLGASAGRRQLSGTARPRPASCCIRASRWMCGW